MKPKDTVRAGTPDTELKTSLIFDDGVEDILSLDAERERSARFFNDVSYPIGLYIRSGNELLRAKNGGSGCGRNPKISAGGDYSPAIDRSG